MIKDRLTALENRGTPAVFVKIIKDDDGIGSHLVNKSIKNRYKYYKCDYCGEEIKIIAKKQEMTGGVAIIPHTVTKKGELKLALCNKCLKPALKEFEEV